MLDFVILYHELPAASKRRSHWDLMLRDGDRLLTWAVDVNPLIDCKAIGQRLPDHRLDYLQYEGRVSGDRGSVTRVARGSYRWLAPISEPTWRAELSLDDGKIVISCANDNSFEFYRL